MPGYKVELISQDEKDRLMENIYSSDLHELKASIHGTCIKFFTDNNEFKEMWEDNFEPMLDFIRPHCRLFAVNGPGKKLRVLYERSSKTVLIYNCDYYGWVKSIALALIADFFEDFTSEHKRYSIHGSFVDFGGRGVAIAGASKSGKTTLTFGMLLKNGYNFITDDWFFVRLTDNDTLIYSSEKNSYIRDDLAENWNSFEKRLRGLKLDKQRRAIIDVKRFFGGGRIRKSSTLHAFVILTREKDKPPFKKLTQKEAVQLMIKSDFCNPHQLIRTKAKKTKKIEFFTELFSRVPVYLLNTIETPKESLERLIGVTKES